MANPYVKFPPDPKDGTVYEVSKGILYRYQASTASWHRVTSTSTSIPVATRTNDGLMSSEDYKKLNKLLLPPLNTTITGGNCPTNFVGGVFDLKSTDSIIEVSGSAELRNIDEFGQTVSKSYDFQVHENTYAFDFTIDLEALTKALAERNNFKTGGIVGDKGPKGPTGKAGADFILAGKPGLQGPQGAGPSCTLSIEPETFSSQGGGKALVDVRLVLDAYDPTVFKLEFDRQAIGITSANNGAYTPTSKVYVRNQESKWILVSESATGVQKPYYLDISQIENAILEKYNSEVGRLKAGYQNTVNYWLQKMSDLYDEQKHALCVALEYCQSVTKNAQQRQHMESVAATAAISGARIDLVTRDSASAATTSGNSLLANLIDPNAPVGNTGTRFPVAGTTTKPKNTSAIGNIQMIDGGAGAGGVTVIDGTAYYPNGSSKVVNKALADAAAAANEKIAEAASNAAAAAAARGDDPEAAAAAIIDNSYVEYVYVRAIGSTTYAEGFLGKNSDLEYSNNIEVLRSKEGETIGSSSWAFFKQQESSQFYNARINMSGVSLADPKQFVAFDFLIDDAGGDEAQQSYGSNGNILAGNTTNRTIKFNWERVRASASIPQTSSSMPNAASATTEYYSVVSNGATACVTSAELAANVSTYVVTGGPYQSINECSAAVSAAASNAGGSSAPNVLPSGMGVPAPPAPPPATNAAATPPSVPSNVPVPPSVPTAPPTPPSAPPAQPGGGDMFNPSGYFPPTSSNAPVYPPTQSNVPFFPPTSNAPVLPPAPPSDSSVPTFPPVPPAPSKLSVSAKYHNININVHYNKAGGLLITLPRGLYRLTILHTDAKVDGFYRADLRVLAGNVSYRLVNKGMFTDEAIANAAYSGLSMDFENPTDGAIIVYMPVNNPSKSDGNIQFNIESRSSHNSAPNVLNDIRKRFESGVARYFYADGLGQSYVIICIPNNIAAQMGGLSDLQYAFAWPVDAADQLIDLANVKFGFNPDVHAELVSKVRHHNGDCNPAALIFPVFNED